MEQQINNDLTHDNCSDAIQLSTLLYNSSYSDNTIRMLYATSQACNSGVTFYGMFNDFLIYDFTSIDNIFKSLVQMFPSRVGLDSILQSAWYAQDALQSIWNPGAVVAPADLFYSTSYNPGSANYYDRTSASNVFLIFVAMAELGAGLNRYGFNSTDTPSTTGYVKTVSLSWTSKALVQADTTGAACGIASSFYNIIDSIEASVGLLPSQISGKLSSVVTVLNSAITVGASTQCTVVDGYTAQECAAASARMRYRNACAEQGAAASVAAGIIQVINAGWI